MSDDQDDLFSGKDERDKALRQVEENAGDFTPNGLAAISQMKRGTRVIGEDLRFDLEERGIIPHDEHAWGMLVKRAIERKLILPTGKLFPMKDVTSHARRSPEYLILGDPYLTSPMDPLPEETPTTNAYYDNEGRLIHDTCAVDDCPKSPGHGVGVSLRKGRLGMWYCEEHWNEIFNST